GTKVQADLSNPKRVQSQGEEIANSISHGIGVLAALVGTPFLVMHAVRHGDAGFIVGTIVFSASMIILYLASALYHAWPIGKVKRCFRIIEHSAIFILIAGTYTPLTLGILRGAWGWTLFGVIWGLAIAGVVLKAFYKTAHPILSTCLYLLMGWLLVIAVKPLFASMPATGLLLLTAGGLSYTAGVAFFATDSRVPYGHLIWHLFVIGGTTCHYFLVLWYAA
ncbi:hemolysin III family protein, partial [Desulfosarcina sp.]|uniref:PAQR family membrane homeostasis protein TrhA n=1 Tax=Desulfosarcina sp. TaxID=2027861 RepID=UPI003563B243